MKKIFLTALIIISTNCIFSQPLPPDYPHGQATNDQPAAAPIDGGLSILLVLGAIFGARKIYILKKKSTKLI
ncbi:MAG: PID-CTERM protein-sorting domain-containing protein [Bacteroidales bacterium]